MIAAAGTLARPPGRPFRRPAPLLAPLARLARRAEFDAAVAWALGVRAWQLVAGPVTAVLIAGRFSETEQDFYYTLAGLMGLDALCRLGVADVLVSLISHAHAGRTDPTNRRRLAGLARFAGRWGLASGAAFAALGGTFGAWTFASADRPPGVAAVDWTGPWAVAAAANGVTVAASCGLAALTGCGRVNAVTKATTVAAVAGNLGSWAVILAGGSLWAAAAACVGRAAVELGLLWRLRGVFAELRPAREADDGSGGGLSWRRDVWPMQWRAAVQNAAQAAAVASLTLALFRHRETLGAGEAGRLGMSLSAATALQFGGAAWLLTRAPRLGALAAAGDRAGFDRLFARVFLASWAAVAAGAVAGTAVLWALNRSGFALVDRLLPVAPFAALVGGSVCLHVPLGLAAYARAWRAEAFVVASAALWAAVAAAAWGLGPTSGAAGVAWGYLAATGGVGVPLFLARWWRFRSRLPG